MAMQLSVVSADLMSLEEALIHLHNEIRTASSVASRLPAVVEGCATAKKTLGLMETMLMCLREEMSGEFLTASSEYAAVLDSAYEEVPF